MTHPELEGRRAIALARCSSDPQTETSIPDQIAVMEKFASENGVAIVDTVTLEGVSASVANNMDQAINDLIRRRASRADFDAILVHDLSRFSRAGARHAAAMRHRLDEAGIDLIPAIGYLEPNPWSDVLDSANATQAREQARSIAAASARGSQSAVRQGRSAHGPRTLSGVDRLIVGEDGAELFVLRNLPDGGQLRLDPRTGEVLERFAPNQRGSASGHYRKARGQRIVLVPGEARARQIVLEIFDGYFRGGLGYHAIARRLNDRGVPSPAGSAWSRETVRGILMNPTYLGVGRANVLTRALYYSRNEGMPKSADARRRKTASGRPALRVRDESEWIEVEHSRLADYLPEDIRESARAAQARYWAARAGREQRAPARDKHRDSEYLLKGILRTKQGGLPMTGRRAGKGPTYRHYAVARGEAFPSSDPALSKRINADPIEDFVLGELRKVLLLMPTLRQRVIEQTIEWQAARAGGTDRREIERQIESLKRRIRLSLDLADELSDEEIKARVSELSARKRALEAELAGDDWPEFTESEIGELVDALLDGLRGIGQVMGELPRHMPRRLLEVFVESATIDLETRELEVVLRVPSWAMAEAHAVGLGSCSESETRREAHAFARFELSYEVPKRYRGAA